MQQILIIDDDLDVRDAMRRVLERAGYRVRTSCDGVDALAELKREAAQVIITDIIMPKMDGVAAIRIILKQFPEVRVIAISGGGNFGIESYLPDSITTSAYLAAAEVAGAFSVLTKPFDAADLVRAVEQALAIVRTVH